MRCDSCGKEIPDHAVFCPKCGAKTGEKGTVGRTSGLPSPPPPHYVPQGARKKTSGLAVASLVLGIGGFVCIPVIPPILAIIFGVMARKEIKKSDGRVEGSGIANAGLALGIVALAIPLILAAIFIPLGINNVGETRTIMRSVPLDGAGSIEAVIKMRTGDLEISGGANPGYMMNGTFTYNVSGWKPDIDHGFSGSTGNFEIEQSGNWWSAGLWGARNEWEIKLNPELPVKLNGNLSSVDSTLNLGSVNLENLNIDTASGNMIADISGDKKLLKSINTRVTSGNTHLGMSGTYSQPIDANVKATSGNIDIDLKGSWAGDLDMSVEATSGNITILLPENVGVYITANVTSGDINADELKMEEDGKEKIFSNDAYEKSKTTLYIDARTTSGNIRLKVKE